MKRFFILASAAIVALASCAKTEVVNNDGPQEIAFKNITGVMTKGNLGDNANVVLGVYADYTAEGASSSTSYFENVMFKGDAESTEWKGDPAQYYPLSGNLDFIGYAPYSVDATYTSNKLTLKLSNNSTTPQVDLLYSTKIEDKDKSTSSTAHIMNLHHALAKVSYNFTIQNITLNKVTLNDTFQAGTYEVDYTQFGVKNDRWTTSGEHVDWEFLGVPTVNDTYLVVPSDQTSITLNYNLGSSNTVEHTIKLSDSWEEGKHYVYNIIITPKEIKFSPVSTTWENTEVNVPEI
jgi:hypothetical protein